MTQSIRLGSALVSCCLMLAAANVARAATAFQGPSAPLVTWETLPRYCVSNVRIVEGPVKGIVVEHHGLGCIGNRELDYSTLGEGDRKTYVECAKLGIVRIHPHYSPWAWMNDYAVRLSDALVTVVKEHYGLGDDATVVSTGCSMGGLGCLVWARYSRHRIAAVAANCPVTDLVYHRTERPDLPATIACAFGDAPDLQAAIEAHSPLHLVKSMPDIPYFVVHSTADRSVGKERHSDRFVAAMKAAGRRIDYVASVGTGHGRLTAAAHARLSAAVLAPFVGEADVRAFGATGNGETDDSAAIQRALDDERRPLIVRIPAGSYRIARTLRVRGGTTILADPKARLFMCDRTPHRAGDHLLTNAGSDGTGGRDRDIAVCGGIWDGNSRRGTNVKPADIFEKGGWSGALLNFRNVDGLVLDGLECANSVTYNIRMCEIDGFAITDIRFSSRERGWNQDGVHMNGFCFNGLIADVRAVTRGQTADDLLAFNADDSMARIENLGMVCGPITNVLCRNVFAEDCHSAIRFLSVVSPIRDVRVENVTVGCRCYAVNADAARYCRTPLFKDEDRPKGVGLLENVTVTNFVFHATSDADMPLLCLETNCRNVTFDGLRRDAALDAAPKRPFARLRKMDDLRYSSDGAVSSLPCGETRELPSPPTTLRLGL